jgi:putative transcriptional regulator
VVPSIAISSLFPPSGGITNTACAGTLVRAFIGYSGWASGQLENELRQNAWIATRPLPDLLGHDHDRTLWQDLLRPLSPFHRLLAEAPDDPFLN